MQRTVTDKSYSSIEAFISTIPEIFDASGKVIFRGRNTIKSLMAPDGTELIVKRFGSLNIARRIAYTLFSHSKARRAFDNGLEFLNRGFQTPQPVAYIEIYQGHLLAECYFVSLRSSGQQLFDSMVETPEFDNSMADRVARLMADLHQSGAVHGDPNLKNILYDSTNDRIELIDTNRSYFTTHLSVGESLRNLMRVSHRRDLIDHIARRYAQLRGLNPDVTSSRIFRLLEKFERNRRIRHRIKAFILQRPVD